VGGKHGDPPAPAAAAASSSTTITRGSDGVHSVEVAEGGAEEDWGQQGAGGRQDGGGGGADADMGGVLVSGRGGEGGECSVVVCLEAM